ncbi:MAG: 2OG-Fe(II) oxygenase [Proteobacteria bacterium]|nr:2OG-Fe(II) oxygenase [Pseudomonadota bacterium]
MALTKSASIRGDEAPDAAARLAAQPWEVIRRQLDESGHAVVEALLTAEECRELVELYPQTERFRNRVVMQRHGFGQGEYQYFARPLPPLVDALRHAIYPELAPVANRWADTIGGGPFPAALESYLDRCHRAGQTKPTPLMLKYEAGDYNCLHQDLYGEMAFPLQVTILLSDSQEDFRGGEFLLVEQRPRMQSKGEIVPLRRGDAVIFATRYRHAAGRRGYFRVNLRHGVSRVLSGRRFSLGIIFHDAK